MHFSYQLSSPKKKSVCRESCTHFESVEMWNVEKGNKKQAPFNGNLI